MMLKYNEMEMIIMDMLTGSKVRVSGPDAEEFIKQFQADIDLAEKNNWTIEIPHDIEIITNPDKTKKKSIRVIKGGPGSGHYDHAGRPGKVGGSAPSGKKVQLPLFDKPDPDESRLPYSEDIARALAIAEVLTGSGHALDRRGFSPEMAAIYWDYLYSENKLRTRDDDDEGLSQEAYIHVVATILGVDGDNEVVDTANLLYDAFEYGDDDTGLRAEVTVITIGYSGDPDQFSIQGKITHEDSEEAVGYFRRIFKQGDSNYDDQQTNFVDHDMFRLDVGYQNQGFGSAFYENSEIAYMNIGLDAIYLEANMAVGGYAWARMGFDFRDDFTLDRYRDDFLRDLLRLYPNDEVDIDYLNSSINHSWDIAAFTGPDGRRVGKEYLLGKAYEAEKILQPWAEGVEVGEAYYEIKKRKKK
jgi:hypothetical protein